MTSCKIILSIVAFTVLLEYGSALKCHYCIPDEETGDLCDGDSGDYRVCDWEAAEEWIESMPKSLRKKIPAKGNSFEPRCIRIEVTEDDETAYVRGCMPETDILCDFIEEEAALEGADAQCSFCGTDGCNGGGGLAWFVKNIFNNKA